MFSDRRFVPGHFITDVQGFRHYERPHWALLSGQWANAPAGAADAGFQQMQPNVNAGYQQVQSAPPAPSRSVAHSLMPAHRVAPPPPNQPLADWQVPIIMRLLGLSG